MAQRPPIALHILSHPTIGGEASVCRKIKDALHDVDGIRIHEHDLFKIAPPEDYQAVVSGMQPHASLAVQQKGRAAAERINQQLRKLFVPSVHNVGIILSWYGHPIALHQSGVDMMPTITWYYPHWTNHTQLDRMQLNAFSRSEVIAPLSPMALKKAIDEGVPAHKLLMIPPSVPSLCHTLSLQPPSMRPLMRNALIKRISQEMGKPHSPSPHAVLVASYDKLGPEKNIVQLLNAFDSAAHRMPNTYLLLKGNEWVSEQDRSEFERLVGKEVQGRWIPGTLWNKPWFLFSRGREPLPQLLQHYVAPTSLLVSVGGAESGPNVVTEAMGLGVPAVVQHTGANPGLYQDAAAYIPSSGTRWLHNAHVPCDEPSIPHLAETLVRLTTDERARQALAEKGKKLVGRHYHEGAFRQRLLTAIDAALYARIGTPTTRTWYEQSLQSQVRADRTTFRV